MTTCGTCGQPVPDQAWLCYGCTGALRLDLQRIGGYRHPDGRWIPGLLADLLTAATHGAVIPGQGGGDDSEWGHTLDHRWPATIATVREPANTAALHLHHVIWSDITGWTRILLEESGLPCHHGSCALGARPACRLTHLADQADANPCRWLEQHADSIRRRDWAPAMLADLDRHLARTERLVDLPAALTVPCPWCKQRVPMDRDVPVIECHCGAAGTLTWWIEQVAPPLPSQPMTLTELPAWLRSRGYEVSTKQLRNWADRGVMPNRIERGEQDARLYDARTALEAAEQSRARRVVPTSLTG